MQEILHGELLADQFPYIDPLLEQMLREHPVTVDSNTGLSQERRAQLSRDLENFLLEPGGQPGERRVIAEVLEKLNTQKHGLIAATVGSGKTLAAPVELLLGGIDGYRPKRVIVIEPTIQLCRNAAELLGNIYGTDLVGHRHGGQDKDRVMNSSASILVVTPGTAWNMFKRRKIGPNDLVFVDEIHQTLNQPEIEALLASLTHSYRLGNRNVGIGMATGTFPEETKESRDFLDFTEAELLHTKEKTKWKRELLPGAGTVESSVMNYLADPSNQNRNLLVLLPSNSKVAKMANDLDEWEASGMCPFQHYGEKPNLAQKIQVVYFSKDVGALDFNERIEKYLQLRATAKANGKPFSERLVIVATYGSAASGVNYPVEDAIGDSHFVQAEDDGLFTRTYERQVRGTMLAQALGRIARYCDGRFYLTGYNGVETTEEMTVSDPLPKPLQSMRNLLPIVFGLIESGSDLTRISQWYSLPTEQMRKHIDQIYLLLATYGLLKSGKLTELAQKVLKNPLSETNIEQALAVEAAAPEIQASLQEIFAIAEFASWRDMFVKDFIAKKERSNDAPAVTDLLLEKELLIRRENGKLTMPDSEDELPDSDVAVMLNVIRYMHNTEFSFKSKDRVVKKHLSLNELCNHFNLAFKATERIFAALEKAVNFNRNNQRTHPGYFTKNNWDEVLRSVIETNMCMSLEAGIRGRRNHTLFSAGVYSDRYESDRDRNSAPELVACLSKSTAKGRNATVETTFAGAILGKIPADLIPWLPHNLLARSMQLKYGYTHSENSPQRVDFEQKFPTISKLYAQCRIFGKQTSALADRTKRTAKFKFDEWFEKTLIPHLLLRKIDTTDAFEALLVELEGIGISLAPEIHDFYSKQQLEEFDEEYPTKIPFGSHEIAVEYSQYTTTLQMPDPILPIQQGKVLVEQHPLLSENLEALQRTIAASGINSHTQRFTLLGTTQNSLSTYVSQPLEKRQADIAKRTLVLIGKSMTQDSDQKSIEKISVSEWRSVLNSIATYPLAEIGNEVKGFLHFYQLVYTYDVNRQQSDAYCATVESTADESTYYNFDNKPEQQLVKTISRLSEAAYALETSGLVAQLTELGNSISPEFFVIMSKDDPYAPILNFAKHISLLAGTFTRAEYIRLMAVMKTAKIGDNGAYAASHFDTTGLERKIAEYLEEARFRMNEIMKKRDVLLKFSHLYTDDSKPTNDQTTALLQLFKLIHIDERSKFFESLNKLTAEAEQFPRFFTHYQELKTSETITVHTERATSMTFSQWLDLKQRHYGLAETLLQAVPLYLTDDIQDRASTIYLVPEEEGWVQKELSAEGFLYGRKGFKSKYAGRTPADVRDEVFDSRSARLGPKGAGILHLQLDDFDLEEIRRTGIALKRQSVAPDALPKTPAKTEDVSYTPTVPTVPVSRTINPPRYLIPDSYLDDGEESTEKITTEPNQSKHEKNLQEWERLRISVLTGEIDQIVKAATTRKTSDYRATELATVFALTNLPFTTLSALQNISLLFPHMEKAKKRLDDMVKEVERRSGISESDASIITAARYFSVILPAIKLASAEFPTWIGADAETQNVAFRHLLDAMSSRAAIDPTLASELQNLLKLRHDEAIPAVIEDFFIETLESEN